MTLPLLAACTSLANLTQTASDAGDEATTPDRPLADATATDVTPGVDSVAPDASPERGGGDAGPTGFCATFDGGKGWRCDDFDNGQFASHWDGIDQHFGGVGALSDAQALSAPASFRAELPGEGGATASLGESFDAARISFQLDFFVDTHATDLNKGASIVRGYLKGYPTFEIDVIPSTSTSMTAQFYTYAQTTFPIGLVASGGWVHVTLSLDGVPADGGPCAVATVSVGAHSSSVDVCQGLSPNTATGISFGPTVGGSGGAWTVFYDNVAFASE